MTWIKHLQRLTWIRNRSAAGRYIGAMMRNTFIGPGQRATFRGLPAEFFHAIRQSNQEPIPASLCMSILLGDGAPARTACLLEEIALLGTLYDPDRELVRIQIDGVSAAVLAQAPVLLLQVAKCFRLSRDCVLTEGDGLCPGPGDLRLDWRSLGEPRADREQGPAPATDLLGIGPGAVSRIGECYARNMPSEERYLERLQQGRLAIFECLHAPVTPGPGPSGAKVTRLRRAPGA